MATKSVAVTLGARSLLRLLLVTRLSEDEVADQITAAVTDEDDDVIGVSFMLGT
jgi:hypothetical protein